MSIGVRAAAERIGVHENTVRGWVRKGIIVPETTSPRRFSEAEVERVRAARRQHAEDRLAAGDVTVGILVVVRTPSGMTPEQAVAEVRKGIGFGQPEVRLHYVLPPAGAQED